MGEVARVEPVVETEPSLFRPGGEDARLRVGGWGQMQAAAVGGEVGQADQAEAPDRITCDRCKTVFDLNDTDGPPGGTFAAQEMLKFRHVCGYGSHVAGGDQSVVETDLCQDCWWTLLGEHCRVSTPKEVG